MKRQGWRKESQKHAMASRGVKTKGHEIDITKPMTRNQEQIYERDIKNLVHQGMVVSSLLEARMHFITISPPTGRLYEEIQNALEIANTKYEHEKTRVETKYGMPGTFKDYYGEV